MKKVLLLAVCCAALGLGIQPSAATSVVDVPNWSISGNLSINSFLGHYVGQPITGLGRTSQTADTFFGPATATADIGLSPAPSVALTTVGKGAVALAALTYFFEVVGPSGTVPINVNAKGYTTPGAGGADYFAVQTTVNPGFTFPVVATPTSGAWTVSGEYGFSANVVYRVLLQVEAEGGGYSYIDPTFAIDPAYSNDYVLKFSAGVVNGVPEPSTWAMMLVGFVGLGTMGWHARRRMIAA